MRPSVAAVVVQSPQGEEVDVEPDGTSPVGGIVLCVAGQVQGTRLAQGPAHNGTLTPGRNGLRP